MPDPINPAAPAAPGAPPATPPAAPVVPPIVPPTQNTPPVPPPAAPAAGEPPPGAPAVAPGQSAEVVYALTLPAESVLETSAVERVTALAKAAKLEPNAAQQVVELTNAEVGRFFEKQKTEYSEKVTGWESQVKADPELGGANAPRTALRSKTVLDRFGDAELTAALQSTGFGNYPALVRFINKLGAAMESDTFTKPGNPATGTPQKVEDVLYPTSAGK